MAAGGGCRILKNPICILHASRVWPEPAITRPRLFLSNAFFSLGPRMVYASKPRRGKLSHGADSHCMSLFPKPDMPRDQGTGPPLFKAI